MSYSTFVLVELQMWVDGIAVINILLIFVLVVVSYACCDFVCLYTKHIKFRQCLHPIFGIPFFKLKNNNSISFLKFTDIPLSPPRSKNVGSSFHPHQIYIYIKIWRGLCLLLQQCRAVMYVLCLLCCGGLQCLKQIVVMYLSCAWGVVSSCVDLI